MCIAVFLSISLVVTLNPFGKNAKAFASTTQETINSSTEESNDSSDDDLSALFDDSNSSYADDAVISSDDETSSDEEINLESVDDSSSSNDDDLTLADLLSSNANDDSSADESADDLLSYLGGDSEDAEDLLSNLNDLESEYSQDAFHLDYDTDSDSITDKKNRYSQYSPSCMPNSINRDSCKIIDCNYSYHVTEDQTGVYIDGLSYIDEDDYKQSDEASPEENPHLQYKTLYIPSHITLKAETNNIEEQKLPVLGISDGAFANQDFFDLVIFADSVDNDLSYYEYLAVESNAFNNCLLLKKIVSARDTLLGEACFANCDMLKNAHFDYNVAHIEDRIFENCQNLTWVYWGNTRINQFSKVNEEFKLDEGFYTFGSNVFAGCNSLEQICVPQSIKYVADNAFADCEKLKEIVIPSSVISLGKQINSFSYDQGKSIIDKVVILNDNLDFDVSSILQTENGETSGTNKLTVYSTEGSQVMKLCFDYGIPFSPDSLTIFQAIGLYSQTDADGGKEVVVEGDQREHEEINFKDGDGSKEKPYVIRNFNDLKAFAEKVNLGQKDACAILDADISVETDTEGAPISNNNWTPIAKEGEGWSGTFNGNNYTISGLTQSTYNNLDKWMLGVDIGAEIGLGIGIGVAIGNIFKTNPILSAALSFVASIGVTVAGFFIRNSWRAKSYPGGFINKTSSGYTVKNVDFINTNFNVQTNTLGGVVSQSYGNGKISSVTIKGDIKPKDVMDEAYYGGLIGRSYSGDLQIVTSVNAATVSSNTFTTRYAGGLIGAADNNVDIQSSANTGTVVGNGADTGEIVMDVIFSTAFGAIDALVAYKASAKVITEAAEKVGIKTANKTALAIKKEFNTYVKERATGLKNLNTMYKDAKNCYEDFYKHWKEPKDYDTWMEFRREHMTPATFAGGDFCKSCQKLSPRSAVLKLKITNEGWFEICDALPNFEDLAKFTDYTEKTANQFFEKIKDFTNPDVLIGLANKTIDNIGDAVDLNTKYLSHFQLIDSYNTKWGTNINIWDVDAMFKDACHNSDFLTYYFTTYKDFNQRMTYLLDPEKFPTLNLISKNGENTNLIWGSSIYNNFVDKELQDSFLQSKKVYENMWFNKNRVVDFCGDYFNPECFLDTFPLYKEGSNDVKIALKYSPNKDELLLRVYDTAGLAHDVSATSVEAYKKLEEFGFDSLSNVLKDGNKTNELKNELKILFDDRQDTLYDIKKGYFGSLFRDNGPCLTYSNKRPWLADLTIEEQKAHAILDTLCGSELGRLLNNEWLSNAYNLALLPILKKIKVPSLLDIPVKYLKIILAKGTSETISQTRSLVNKFSLQNWRKANIDAVKKTGNVYTQTTYATNSDTASTSDSNEDNAVPLYNQYKKVISTTSTNDQSVDEQIIKMCEEIPEEAIDGEAVNSLSRKSAIMHSSDAQNYVQEAQLDLNQCIKSLYFNGLSKDEGFGTWAGVGGGLIGTTGNKSDVTFTSCTNSANVMGGETAGGFIGVNNSNSEVVFEKCWALSNSTVCAVDSGKVSNDAKKPTAGGFIGLHNNGTHRLVGCTSESKQLSKTYTGNYFGHDKSSKKSTTDLCVSSGISYSDNGGCTGGFYGKLDHQDAASVTNSYVDGIVAGRNCKNKGYISGSPINSSNLSNVWYYCSESVYSDGVFAKSFAPGNDNFVSNGNVTCMKDTKMIQSGELCFKLNQNVGEGVFGQNLGILPYVKEETDKEGKKASKVELKSTAKSERPLPFMEMPVFTYTECETPVNNDSNNTGSEAENNNSSAQTNVKETQHYFNFPSTKLLDYDINFVDIDCDENCICKPQGGIYVNADSTYTVQFMATNSTEIKKVMLDNVDITNKITQNKDTLAYEYVLSNITENHSLYISTQHKDYSQQPDFEDGYYLIKNINNLLWYKNNYASLVKANKPANAKLVNDIDLISWKDICGSSWVSLGSDDVEYVSEFDGQGFSIKNLNTQSLFGNTKNANIHDVVLENYNNSSSALIDTASGNTSITNVKLVNGCNLNCGFIVNVTGPLHVDGCHIESTQLTANAHNANVAGIAGKIDNNNQTIQITNCAVGSYNSHLAITSDIKNSKLAGLIGDLKNTSETVIYQCEVYVDASYSGPDGYDTAYIGGLIANGEYKAGVFEDSSKVKVTNSVIGGILCNNNSCFTSGVGGLTSLSINSCFVNFSQLSAKQSDEEGNLTYLTNSLLKDCSNVWVNAEPQTERIDHTTYAPKAKEGWDRGVWLDYFDGASPLSTGQATYELSNSCEQFVQQVDDENIQILSVPTLNLKYKANAPDQVIKFDANGADNFLDEMTPMLIDNGETKKLTKNTYVRNGYTFRGWSKSKNGKVDFKDGEDYKAQNDPLSRTTTLYAVWYLNVGSINDEADNTSQENPVNLSSENSNSTNNATEYSDNNDHSKIKEIPGKVFKYKYWNSDEYYYSNLYDANSYIVRPSNGDIKCENFETRVSSGSKSSISITPKRGYIIKDVSVELKYVNSDEEQTKLDEKQKLFHPSLTLGQTLSVVTIENVYSYGVVEVTVETEPYGAIRPQGQGTEDDPFIITKAQELLYISHLVNDGVDGGEPMADPCVKIDKNIDLTSLDFASIGTQKHPFSGKFSGEFVKPNGEISCYSISGLSDVSLFGVTNNATISDLSINGSNCEQSILANKLQFTQVSNVDCSGTVHDSKTSNTGVGAIAAYATGTTITNCNNYAFVEVLNAKSNHLGGIVGLTDEESTKFENCTNYGICCAEKANTSIGGIVGTAGTNAKAVFVHCVNSGLIYCDDNGCKGTVCGGILGKYNYKKDFGRSSYVKIKQCENINNIDGKFDACGGIVGLVKTKADEVGFYEGNCTIEGCINNGSLSAFGDCGGILGRNGGFDGPYINKCCSSATSIMSEKKSAGLFCGSVVKKGDAQTKVQDSICKDLANVDVSGHGSCSSSDITKVQNSSAFLSGQVAFEMNQKSPGCFYQCLDIAGEETDYVPHVVLEENDANKYPINKIEKNYLDGTSEVFYSNHNQDELCYCSPSLDNADIKFNLLKKHYAIGEELQLSVNSINAKFIDEVKIINASQDVVYEFSAKGNQSELTLNYKFEEPGDYVIEATTKHPETQEPKLVDDWYQVSNAKELQWISQEVNENHNNSINFKLVSDIDMTGEMFAPIGSGIDFRGCFDGAKNNGSDDCYTISHLNTASTNLPGGLFGATDSAYLANCKLVDVNAIGGGFAYSHLCTNPATPNSKIGIYNVTIYGKVSAYTYSSESSHGVTSAAGGIVGYLWESSIYNCANYCRVECITDDSSDKVYAGGIVAFVTGGPGSVIDGCTNNGTIYASGSSDMKTHSEQRIYASGGIVGCAYWDNMLCEDIQLVSIQNCSNFGLICGEDTDSGGIIGRVGGWDTSSSFLINAHEASITLSNCSSTGDVGNIDYHIANSGGLIGRIHDNRSDFAWNVYISNSFSRGVVESNSLRCENNAGGLIGCASEYNELSFVSSYVFSPKIWSPKGTESTGLFIGKNLSENVSPGFCKFSTSNIFSNTFNDLEICCKDIEATGSLSHQKQQIAYTVCDSAMDRSGKLCYLLNNKISNDKCAFKQDLGLNALGTSFPNSMLREDNKIVYYGIVKSTGELGYSNNPEDLIIANPDGDGSQDNPFIIKHAINLIWLSNELSCGKVSRDANIKIVEDIDMSAYPCPYNFMPFGSTDDPFRGKVNAAFEKDNGEVQIHKISNFDLVSNGNVDSIFGVCEGATFNSIVFDNIKSSVAIIASKSKNTTIASVKVVNSSVGSANSNSVGGLVGVADDNTVISTCSVELKSGATCKNFGVIAGEVAGSNVDINMIEIDGDLVVDNHNNSCHVGGAIGSITNSNKTDITNFDNTATISTINGATDSSLGGVAGSIEQNTKEVNITGCSAFGETGSENTNGSVGGLVGSIQPIVKDSKVCFEDCGNLGHTSSTLNAGGFVGLFDSDETLLKADYCFNADKVIAKNNNASVETAAGGFIGRIAKSGKSNSHQAVSMDWVYSSANNIEGTLAGTVFGVGNSFDSSCGKCYINGLVAKANKRWFGEGNISDEHLSELSAEEFKNGEACWRLNGEKNPTDHKYEYLQTIDKKDKYVVDASPKLENAEHVYNISKTYGKNELSNYNHEVYRVKSAEDLVKLVDVVDSGKVDLEVVLDNDIDMSGITWDKPIGYDSNKPFCGCFNGNGKTISNLNGLALFGYTSVDQLSSEYKNSSIIHNVKFENAHCKGAVLVQNSSRTEIYNVETKGIVDPSIQLTPMQSTTENGTGAIVGSANKETKVHDCKNYCYVSGTTMYVGGVVGYMQGDKDRSTGYVYGSSIQNCQNYGDVVISVLTDPFSADFNSGSAFEDSDEVDTSEIDDIKEDNQYEDYVQAKPELKPTDIIVAGGVLGSLGFYSSIDHCTNEGTVSSAYLGAKPTMLGGVLGQVYMYNMNAELNDCVNTGNILGGTFAGGLVGNVCMAKVAINRCQSQANCLGSSEYGSAGIGAIWLNANVDINNSDVECKTNDSANPAVLCSYVESNLDIGDNVRLYKAKFEMYKTVAQGRVNGDYITVDTPAEQTNVQPANNTAVKVNVTALNNGSASINEATASDDGNVSVDVNANSKVVITLQADQGYMTDVVKFGDKQVDLNGKETYELEVGTENIDVYVSFKESTETVNSPTKEDPGAYKLVRENKVFTKWTSDKELPTETGNYYLTKDVVLSSTWNVPAGANISLSLDGHSITQAGNNSKVIEVNNGANLEVYDLRTNGRCFYFDEQKDASGKQVGPWKLLGDNATYKAPADFPEDYRCDGGIITGSTGDKGCGIEVAHGGSAVMHQGNIVGNIGNISAGGVNNHGTFVNKHAYIVGNYGKYVGGIVNHTDGSFTLNYVVAHNVAEMSVGGIRNVGAMNIEGLTQVSGNILNCSDSSHPDVYKPAYSDLSLSTIDVLNNNKDDSGDIVTQSCRLTYTGVTVNPFNINYTLGNIASLGPLDWILTTNFSKHTIHPQNIVVKLKVSNPQYRVDVLNGELTVLKK